MDSCPQAQLYGDLGKIMSPDAIASLISRLEERLCLGNRAVAGLTRMSS